MSGWRDEGDIYANGVDIDRLLEQILSDPRLRSSKAFSTTKTYADEPIIRRGSQMDSYLPKEIGQMRELQRTPRGRTWSETRLFYEQARLMEDFEDNCPYHGQFQSYYPTYRTMTDRQLRGYFTWRARVRAGQVEQTAASFAYVYLYELLMGIGVEPGRKAFDAIEAFWKTYRQFDPGMDRYVPEWLVDYVVEHDLPAELAAPYAHLEHDAAIAVLERAEKDALAAAPPKGHRRQPTDFAAMGGAAGEFAQAVCQLSSYRLDESRLYKERPEDVSCVLLAVYSRLALHYRGSRTQGLTETLFGLRFAVRHVMYASAVRYEPGFHEDCVYELSPTRRYVCKNGLWSRDSYHDGGARSAKLGQIARAVDRQLRQALGYAHPLKDHAEAKYLVKIIDDEIAAYLGWKQAAAPRRVEIDLSKLAGIRSAAAVTREALLVDEEREGSAVEGAPVASSSSNSFAAKSAAAELWAEKQREPVAAPCAQDAFGAAGDGSDALGLSEDETALLRALLDGRKYAGPGNVGLMVDAINEALFDLLGDTAIEFGADGEPRLVEDYAEDVRAAL